MQFNTNSYLWGCPSFEEYTERYHRTQDLLIEDGLTCDEILEDEKANADFELKRVPAITKEDIENVKMMKEDKENASPIPGKNMVNYT